MEWWSSGYRILLTETECRRQVEWLTAASSCDVSDSLVPRLSRLHQVVNTSHVLIHCQKHISRYCHIRYAAHWTVDWRPAVRPHASCRWTRVTHAFRLTQFQPTTYCSTTLYRSYTITTYNTQRNIKICNQWYTDGEIAQSVECWALDRKVPGSNPVRVDSALHPLWSIKWVAQRAEVSRESLLRTNPPNRDCLLYTSDAADE